MGQLVERVGIFGKLIVFFEFDVLLIELVGICTFPNADADALSLALYRVVR